MRTILLTFLVNLFICLPCLAQIEAKLPLLLWDKASCTEELANIDTVHAKNILIYKAEDRDNQKLLNQLANSNPQLNICLDMDEMQVGNSFYPAPVDFEAITTSKFHNAFRSLLAGRVLKIKASSYASFGHPQADLWNYRTTQNTEKLLYPKGLKKMQKYTEAQALGGEGFIYKFNPMKQRYVPKNFYQLELGGKLFQLSFNPARAYQSLLQAFNEGEITTQQIDARLIEKEKLNPSAPLKTHYQEAQFLDSLYHSTTVLLQNPNQQLPLKNLTTGSTAMVCFGSQKKFTQLREYCSKYSKLTNFLIKKGNTAAYIEELSIKLQTFKQVILVYENLTETLLETYKKLVNLLPNTVQVVFGNSIHSATEFTQAVVYAPLKSRGAQKKIAQILFGGLPARGQLTEEIGSFEKGYGLSSTTLPVLRFGSPEQEGLDGAYLEHQLDSIVAIALKEKAFPGCQILVCKNSNVVFHKTYGYHTYFQAQATGLEDVYDLASVTKIAAATLAVMRMRQEGKMALDAPLANYWDGFNREGKEKLTVREILAHQAGLKPYIQFWKETLDEEGEFKSFSFEYQRSWFHTIKVYEHMYLWAGYRDDFLEMIDESPLLPEKKYKYSGLSFYLYPEIVTAMYGQRFDDFLAQEFYNKLGASSMMFNPHEQLERNAIVPTEQDDFFRNSLLQGYVHDEGAAVFGGVSGNAGLFSNATDLAKLLQMWLNGGKYGTENYFQKSVIEEFTSVQFPENENRRGLGFDKPLLGNDTLSLEEAYPAPSCSPDSYGHSGYTGTFVWADPVHNLSFIFLSNRVHPTRENRKIYKLNTRIRLHEAIYQSFLDKPSSN